MAGVYASPLEDLDCSGNFEYRYQTICYVHGCGEDKWVIPVTLLLNLVLILFWAATLIPRLRRFEIPMRLIMVIYTAARMYLEVETMVVPLLLVASVTIVTYIQLSPDSKKKKKDK